MSNIYFFEDLHVGQTATLSKTITDADTLMYSVISLDTNPIHLDEEAALMKRLCAIRASAVVSRTGCCPPAFRAPVKIGHTGKAIVEITDLNLSRKSATLRTRCLVMEDVVIDGEACVLVPSRS